MYCNIDDLDAEQIPLGCARMCCNVDDQNARHTMCCNVDGLLFNGRCIFRNSVLFCSFAHFMVGCATRAECSSILEALSTKVEILKMQTY
jgi:hypothetical protein